MSSRRESRDRQSGVAPEVFLTLRRFSGVISWAQVYPKRQSTEARQLSQLREPYCPTKAALIVRLVVYDREALVLK